MNDSIVTSSMETDFKTFHEEYLEEYRGWFLIYLDIAEKLLDFEAVLQEANKMKEIFKNGRTFGEDSEEETAIAIGDFLHHRYGMKWSIEGFYVATARLQSEFNATKTLEKSLWEKLLEAGKKAWYNDEMSICRLEGKTFSCTRTLLTTTPEAKHRIKCYREELSQKTEESISPDFLEITFHSTHAALWSLAPVKFH
ncbi:hypothetical protein IKG24_00585 [Candidatus Saccharibacteria bacterium]|nr:hypothetical protein [Candidatus Saccharibacteria bacterium]